MLFRSKQGTSVGAIQSMNKGLTDPSKIAKGAKLNLPTSVKEDMEGVEEGIGDFIKGGIKMLNKAPGLYKSAMAKGMSSPKMNLGKEVSAPRPNYSSSTSSSTSPVSSIADKAKKVAAGAIGGAIGGSAVDSDRDRKSTRLNSSH